MHNDKKQIACHKDYATLVYEINFYNMKNVKDGITTTTGISIKEGQNIIILSGPVSNKQLSEIKKNFSDLRIGESLDSQKKFKYYMKALVALGPFHKMEGMLPQETRSVGYNKYLSNLSIFDEYMSSHITYRTVSDFENYQPVQKVQKQISETLRVNEYFNSKYIFIFCPPAMTTIVGLMLSGNHPKVLERFCTKPGDGFLISSQTVTKLEI